MQTQQKQRTHSERAQEQLQQLAASLRSAVHEIDDPRGQALFETGAEVLLGLNKAFADYGLKNESAMNWPRRTLAPTGSPHAA